jgi:hypothetical protein
MPDAAPEPSAAVAGTPESLVAVADVPVPVAHGGSHDVEPLHDETHQFTKLDRSYGKAVLIGYAGGFLVIFAFLVITLVVVGDIPAIAVVASGIAVAFWMGILGGVVAVGRWAMEHEEEIHHA